MKKILFIVLQLVSIAAFAQHDMPGMKMPAEKKETKKPVAK